MSITDVTQVGWVVAVEKWWEKPPSNSEADLQSGVSIMLVESRKIEHCNVVVAGISFNPILYSVFSMDILYKKGNYL